MAANDPVQFTRGSAQRIADATRRVEAMPPNRIPPTSGRGDIPLSWDRFFAKITGNASLATNRWKYAWTEVLISGDVAADRTGGRSGTTSTDYAINLSEMYHTSTYAWGVDITGTDYDATTSFAPRPVGGGGAADTHRYNVIVEMIQVVNVGGSKKFVFSAFGSHDGAC